MGARKFALSSTVAWPRAPSGRLRAAPMPHALSASVISAPPRRSPLVGARRSARTSKHETTCPGRTSTYSIPSRAGKVPQIAWLTSEAVLPARIGIDHLPADSPQSAVELHAHCLSQGSARLTRVASNAGLGIAATLESRVRQASQVVRATLASRGSTSRLESLQVALPALR